MERNTTLNICTFDGYDLLVEIEPNMTILELKKYIQIETGIDSVNQRLKSHNMYCSETLEDNRVVSYCLIQGQRLFLEITGGEVTMEQVIHANELKRDEEVLQTLIDSRSQYEDDLKTAIGTRDVRTVEILLDLIRSHSPSDILQESLVFYSSMKTGQMLLIVDEKYMLNMNHEYVGCLKRLDIESYSDLLYDGACVGDENVLIKPS